MHDRIFQDVNSHYLPEGYRLKYSTNFSEDKTLIDRLKKLAENSYLDVSQLLDREISHCKEIFYIQNSQENILCFSMYNFELIDEIESVYFGLTVCDENYKSLGFAKYLWQQIGLKVIKRQLISNKEILCWLTTPTPIVFYWFNKFLKNAEPFLDGKYSENGRALVEKLKIAKYQNVIRKDSNPFILRKVASKTLYSETERLRIIDAKKRLGVYAFSNYNVDETKGDRFLITGYISSI